MGSIRWRAACGTFCPTSLQNFLCYELGSQLLQARRVEHLDVWMCVCNVTHTLGTYYSVHSRPGREREVVRQTIERAANRVCQVSNYSRAQPKILLGVDKKR